MILLATLQLMATGAEGHPPVANIHGFGSLFGVTVYAFMCHHSLPSLITPMRFSPLKKLKLFSSKQGLFPKLLGVFIVVFVFYAALSLTGAYAFEHVQVCDASISLARLILGRVHTELPSRREDVVFHLHLRPLPCTLSSLHVDDQLSDRRQHSH